MKITNASAQMVSIFLQANQVVKHVFKIVLFALLPTVVILVPSISSGTINKTSAQ